MKTPLVFSYAREQSVFMTAIMSLLTFLSVLTLGIALSIGTGARRWNTQWDLFATVQVMSQDDAVATMRILDNNANKIAQIKEISKQNMEDMLRPWITGGSGSLANYLPQMFEVKFKNKSDIKSVGDEISKHARFLTHSEALRNSTNSGWRMIWISALVLLLTLGAIGFCISHIACNTAMIHRRELEILNQIGANDSFVVRQMQIIVTKICSMAAAIGFVAALPVIGLILSTAHSARVGLMAMVGLSGAGWTALALMPFAIVIFAIWITKKTTVKILENS